MNKEILLSCRLCGNNNDMNTDIFEEDTFPNNIKLKDKILIVIGLIVVENDVITTKICIECKDTVEKMFSFRKRAYETNLKLLSTVRLISQNTSNETSTNNCVQRQGDNCLVNESKKNHDNSEKNTKYMEQNHIIANKYLDRNQTKDKFNTNNELYSSSVISNSLEDNDFSDELEWDVQFPLDDISESVLPIYKTFESKNHAVRPFVKKIEAKYGVTVDPEISDFDYDACRVCLERMKMNIVSNKKISPNRQNRTLKRSIDDEILLPNAYCVPLRLKSLSVIPALRYTRDNINVMFSENNRKHCMMKVINESNTNMPYNVAKEFTNPYVKNVLHYMCNFCNQRFSCNLFLSQHINTCHGESIRNDLLKLKVPRLELDKNYSKLYSRNEISDNTGSVNSVLLPIPLHQTQHNININSLPIITFDQAMEVQNKIVHGMEYQKLKQNSKVLIPQLPSVIRSVKNTKLPNVKPYGIIKTYSRKDKNILTKSKLINHSEEKLIKFNQFNTNIKDISVTSDSSHSENITKSNEDHDHCYCVIPNFKKSSASKPQHKLKVLTILTPSKINSMIENKLKIISPATN